MITGSYRRVRLTERLHLPQHDAKRPHVSFEAIIVVLEVLWWVPAQWNPLLLQTHGKYSGFLIYTCIYTNVTSGSANYHETQTTVVVEFVSGALSDELREDG